MVALFVALMFIGFILLDLALQKVEARRAARGLTLAQHAQSRRAGQLLVPSRWTGGRYCRRAFTFPGP